MTKFRVRVGQRTLIERAKRLLMERVNEVGEQAAYDPAESEWACRVACANVLRELAQRPEHAQFAQRLRAYADRFECGIARLPVVRGEMGASQ